MKTGRQIPVVMATSVLRSFVSGWRAAALALADLGVAAFFIAGVAEQTLGPSAPWFVLAAVLLGLGIRAIDLESWTLFASGGLVGRVEAAFGPRLVPVAAAAVLGERLLLAALCCAAAGQYGASIVHTLAEGWPIEAHLAPDVTTLGALAVIGFWWIRSRLGRTVSSNTVARHVWIAVAVLSLVVVWGAAAVLTHGVRWLPPLPAPSSGHPRLIDALALVWVCLVGLGRALPGAGSGDSLPRVAAELEPPRIRGLRRTTLAVGGYALVITTGLSFLFGALVPPSADGSWVGVPVAGLVQALPGPAAARLLLLVAVVVAAVLLLGHGVRACLDDAENTLVRLARRGMLSDAFRRPHPKFGTLTRVTDTAAAAIALAVLASGARVDWLAAAYAVGIVWTVGLKVASLVRLRSHEPVPSSFTVPLTIRARRGEWPIGAWLVGAVVLAAGLAALSTGDAWSLAGTGMLVGLALAFSVNRRRLASTVEPAESEASQLLPSTELSIDRVDARAGAVLVAVRNPHALLHLTAALQTARDRDVVVMTARLFDVDVADDVGDAHPTTAERALFSHVLAVAERSGRPVRLLVVPSHDVFDAVMAAVVRLRASEVYVGDSATLSADAQARLLGEAWERVDTTDLPPVRLVICHRSGRRDTFHLGAHEPALTPSDLDLIHRLWLDAAKSVGPHVHHHDIVRAALKQMAERLDGPERDSALQAIRQVAKPADELAAAVRTRDFSRLRDTVRNRPPSDLAGLLTDLSIEDQVVVFRLLPRKDAAATFEYLSHDAQETLLKAMAQEDVASLLNNMAPDDRTMFLEELPATVTRQLLPLLTPEERAVAVTLLGYPEDSIGRLMTPDYVALREDWTIQQVLDYIRTHGQDSETLNVIYVVDEQGLLIDDLRIRELLLAPPDRRVSDLMDRRFVALKATDDQETAVTAFRSHDRVALPVTDTAGMLIGIVTVDDVLHVVEEAATADMQRIGGSEALDEPYMTIAFRRMLRKRAGWLTALFLGEMLTATAMNAFEGEITKAVVLALFVPLIISSGGNSGSQASTLVIRALALGEIGLRDWWRIARRELAAGFSLGAVLGTIGALRITLWSIISPSLYGPHWPVIALTVGLALVGVVMWGTLIGSLLPLLLRRLGFDPATSSAPFVATLVDVTGLIIYFLVASVTLSGTLLKPV